MVLALVIGALSACAGSMPTLSEEKKAEIENAWYTQYKWCWLDYPNGEYCRYYGNYEGYDIFYVITAHLKDMILCTILQEFLRIITIIVL